MTASTNETNQAHWRDCNLPRDHRNICQHLDVPVPTRVAGATWLLPANPGSYFVDTDAFGETHLWRGTRDDPAPKIALSKDGPNAADPVVWALSVAALTEAS